MTSNGERTALYAKPLPNSGEIAKEVSIIADGFTEIVSIGSFGGWIYVADSELGFYGIEYDQMTMNFSEPRSLNIKHGENAEKSPKPATMVVFTLSGLALLMNATAVIGASLALMALF